jgi:hypothetical protein
MSQQRAYDQTVEEWLLEYETGVPVRPAAWDMPTVTTRAATVVPASEFVRRRQDAEKLPQRSRQSALPLLRYEMYKTTKLGRLNLVFNMAGSADDVVAWFNITIKKQRAVGKALPIKTGVGGYFYPEPRSKFRKFWEQVFGPPKIRWGAVYRRMGRLKGIVFTGELVTKVDAKGEPYIQVNGLRLADSVDIRETQNGYNNSTNSAQVVNSKREQ